ncbi:hypothetical protein HPB49_011232 [Dermacentor silvarum]|uniref:Uncharacterized protein n=1 Tax=Dermacentor silvarum TaxID=543639 RepID=A0ACB8C372_DERSI|nr:hypothetical protein HPB49_011232 [Dermacentor silvarum]
MPHRKRYKKYLYDSACEVPVRTKCRRKALDDENGGGGGTSASDSDEDSRSAHERRSESTCCDRGSSLPSSPLADSSCDDESFSDIAENAFVCSNDGNINAADTLRYDSSSSEDEESNQGTEEAEQTRNELDGPLYPESKLSRGQSLVMVMAHSLRHHSSKEATESLLKVIDAHMPQVERQPAKRRIGPEGEVAAASDSAVLEAIKELQKSVMRQAECLDLVARKVAVIERRLGLGENSLAVPVTPVSLVPQAGPVISSKLKNCLASGPKYTGCIRRAVSVPVGTSVGTSFINTSLPCASVSKSTVTPAKTSSRGENPSPSERGESPEPEGPVPEGPASSGNPGFSIQPQRRREEGSAAQEGRGGPAPWDSHQRLKSTEPELPGARAAWLPPQKSLGSPDCALTGTAGLDDRQPG